MVGCIVDDKRPVKIAISSGLIGLVVFAILSLVLLERMAPRIEAGLGLEPKQQYVPGGVSYDDGKTAPLNQMPINESAAREKKKQSGAINTGNFMQSVPNSRPSGNKMFPRDHTQEIESPQLISQASSNGPATPAPAAPNAPANLTSTPTTPRYSTSIFVGSDAKSQAFLEWWNTDSQLQAVKKSTNFQAYTKDNPLYRSRYASLVPITDFPAVIISDADGGHVYAASGYGLPTSATILYREIYDAFQIHKQVVQPGEPGPINSDAFSSSAQPDCPDGLCVPADRQPFLNPERSGVFPLLRPKPNPVESLFTWIFFPETAIMFLLCVFTAFAIVVVLLIRVFRS